MPQGLDPHVRMMHLVAARKILSELKDFALVRWEVGDILLKLEELEQRLERIMGYGDVIKEIREYAGMLREKYDSYTDRIDEAEANRLQYLTGKWEIRFRIALEDGV